MPNIDGYHSLEIASSKIILINYRNYIYMHKIWVQSCNRVTISKDDISSCSVVPCTCSKASAIFHSLVKKGKNMKETSKVVAKSWKHTHKPHFCGFCHQNGFAPLDFKRIIMKQKLVWTFITFLEIPVVWTGGGTELEVWWCISPGLERDMPSLNQTLAEKHWQEHNVLSLAKTAHPHQIIWPLLFQILNSGQNLELDHCQEWKTLPSSLMYNPTFKFKILWTATNDQPDNITLH